MDSQSAEHLRLAAFQDRVIAIVKALPSGFYLAGRAAACRGYLNHRMTHELLFACNNHNQFEPWAEQALASLINDQSWKTELSAREPRRLSVALLHHDQALLVTFLNDSPLHIGTLRSHPVLGRLDSPENIAAHAMLSIITQAEPGDLADLLGLCVRFNLDLQTLLTSPQSKAAGIFPPDLARALHMADRRDWELVRWIQSPPLEMYLGQLKRLGTRVLALNLPAPKPAQAAPPTPRPAAQAAPVQQPVKVDTIVFKDALDSPQPANPPVKPTTLPLVDETANPPTKPTTLPLVEEAPNVPEPAPEPPVVKRGTGILNYYRALKAAGLDGFLDAKDSGGSPDETPFGDVPPPFPDARRNQPPPVPQHKEDSRPSQPWSPTVVTGQVKPREPRPAAPPSQHKDLAELTELAAKLSPGDKRSELRRRVSYYVPVIDTEDEQPVGYLADISKSGLCLDSKGPLIKGSRLHLRIDLPPELGPKPHILFAAEVRWTRVDPTDPNAYSSGLRVLNMSSEDARSFIKIIEKYSYE